MSAMDQAAKYSSESEFHHGFGDYRQNAPPTVSNENAILDISSATTAYHQSALRPGGDFGSFFALARFPFTPGSPQLYSPVIEISLRGLS
jgi:hypothetical protein